MQAICPRQGQHLRLDSGTIWPCRKGMQTTVVSNKKGVCKLSLFPKAKPAPDWASSRSWIANLAQSNGERPYQEATGALPLIEMVELNL